MNIYNLQQMECEKLLSINTNKLRTIVFMINSEKADLNTNSVLKDIQTLWL